MLKLFIITSGDIGVGDIRRALLFHSLSPTLLLSGGTKNYRAVEEWGRNNGITIEKYSPQKGNSPWEERCKERLNVILEKADITLLIIGKKHSPSLSYVYDYVIRNNKKFLIYK